MSQFRSSAKILTVPPRPAQADGARKAASGKAQVARKAQVGSVTEPGLYLSYYGLHERPFTLLPDPDFLFWSPAHRRAFAVLEYGVISRAPITLLTGEVGAGKTTLIQELLRHLDEDTSIGLVSNAQGGRGELLQWVLNSLDVPYAQQTDYVALFQTLQDFLITRYAEGGRVAIIIDEAQNLSIELLEELRMLTNINSGKDELLQLILVGQPELRDLVMRRQLRQFAQRIVGSFHLTNMDSRTVADYISHRLRHAGGTGTEFTRGAAQKIHEVTGGVPRLVNKLCDFSMVYSSIADERVVSGSIVQDVLDDGVFLMPGMADDGVVEATEGTG